MFYNIPLLLLYSVIAFVLLCLLYTTNYRWLSLLIPSIVCYCIVGENHIWLLVVFSIIVYYGAHYLSQRPSVSKQVYWLILALALAPLLFYKFNAIIFFLASRSLPETVAFQMEILYPIVGLSFFTFNGISYLVDVKKGYVQSEKNYALLLLYLAYFPHILAGPLHRAKFLLPQFKTGIVLSAQNFSRGFRLLLWGVFKKYVLAYHLKILTDSILDYPDSYHGFYVLLGGFTFFLQIYCDFTSYVEISQGISQFFGIQLKPNFNDRVYASTSRKQFWDGWHITLNHWFRDYFFFAITKKAKRQWQLNLGVLLTFILIGLWHGVTLSFIIWGFLNGCWLLLEKQWKPKFDFINMKVRNSLGLLYHLSVSSFIALVFRSSFLHETLVSLFNFSEKSLVTFSIDKSLILSFIFMDFIYRKAKNRRIDEYVGAQKTYVRWLFYFAVTTIILYWGVPPNDFYYFKF